MIQISGDMVNLENLTNMYSPDSVERKIIDILSLSSEVYTYSTLEELKFELDLRKNIVETSKQLNRSRFGFRIFRKSTCNSDYWKRTDEGGFLLKEGVTPADGIQDIFINSAKYATECATAIVIIYYKAILNIFPQSLFNEMFSTIYLMNWKDLDEDLGIRYYKNLSDYLPGDCRYFKNPDVDPLTPEWQGENVIDLGEGRYYGHGIGIKTADGIIQSLNRHRKIGATESAYLLPSATRPAFKYLAKRYKKFSQLRNRKIS
ncbi:protein-glutamine gamma-glutamyltransferase [Clostridiaceae bacterium 35-E11]